MESDPATSFSKKYTKLFTHKEKTEHQILTENTPVLAFFRSLSQKGTTFGDINIQKPKTGKYRSDSATEKDLKARNVSSPKSNSSSNNKSSETQAEGGLPKTGELGHCASTGRSLLEQPNNNLKTEGSISMDQKEFNLVETASHTEKKLLDIDLQVSVSNERSCQDISSTCQADWGVADGHTDLLSRALSQESTDGSLSYTVPAESHSSVDLSDVSEAVMVKQTACLNSSAVLADKAEVTVNDNDKVVTSNTNVFNIRDSQESHVSCRILGISTNLTNEAVSSIDNDESKLQEKTDVLKHTNRKTLHALNIDRTKDPYIMHELKMISEDISSPVSTDNSKEFFGKNDTLYTIGSTLVLSNGNAKYPVTGESKILNNLTLFPSKPVQNSSVDAAYAQEGQAPHITNTNSMSPSSPGFSRTVVITRVEALSDHSEGDGHTIQPVLVQKPEMERWIGGGIESYRGSSSMEGHLSTVSEDSESPSNLHKMTVTRRFSGSLMERMDAPTEICTVLSCNSDSLLEPTAADSQNETHDDAEMVNDIQDTAKIKIKKIHGIDGGEKADEKHNLTQDAHKDRAMKEEEGQEKIIQADTNPLNSASGKPCDSPTTESGSLHAPGITSSQSTFFRGPVLDKPLQIPSIFSGLKGLKKEVGDRQTAAAGPEQLTGPDPKKGKSFKRGLFADQRSKKEVKGSFLEQLSQLLSFDASRMEQKKEQLVTARPPLSPSSQGPWSEELAIDNTVEDRDVTSSDDKSKSPNTETPLDAFKAFFTPKASKRDTSDRIDLKMLNKEAICAIFDRSPNKSTDNENISKSPESEERTPGRLQAIWPPPKPRDEEEKIGLKYTEAEHQAVLLHLKRECKEELETLEADYKLQLFRSREEGAEAVARLQAAVVELKERAARSRGNIRDVAVSTEDAPGTRTFRTVCIQTDRDSFIKPAEGAGLPTGTSSQPCTPKKLNITSVHLSLSGKQEPAPKQGHLPPPPLPPTLPVQSDGNNATPPPPSLPGPCDDKVFSNLNQSLDGQALLRQGSGPPPPPPPPPTGGCGPSPSPFLGSALPPPPPLFLSSALTPPAPAGLFISGAEEWPQRKARVEPVCPMKPLYWTRIQIQDNRNDMLWNSLKEPDIINSDEFAELFAKMATPTRRKPLSEAYEKKVKPKKIIKLLDGKRSQAVGIFISSLHLEMKDIRHAVLMLDNSVVDVDTIEALYENRAQPEELARIRKHYETSDEEHVKLLDKPEQFLYELSQIPDFSLRAHCIILQSTFPDAIASIQRKTEIVICVCQGLLEWSSVKEILGLVLALGNYMNGGSRTRGQADGFSLEILPKLKDVKSRDNRISLVDYVVTYYVRNLDQNAGTESCVFPLPEPQDLFLAAQVRFEDLSKELRKLGKDLAVCEKDVEAVCSKSPEEYIHPFKEKMEAFISNAQNQQIATERYLISAQKSFLDLVKFFGIKPRCGEQDVLPGYAFMLWFEFCNDFKTRWKRENKAVSKERLKEAQQSVHNITAEKRVETRRIHANGLKERLRLKQASLAST